ncbi:unnamed protein product [Vitrella brassicaformis CCMP3155]|uniref:Uncharacterized protein n=1 Tax=Vitrella brassicaformis (strain CCMP3155) TaxID=1169540 RepID=A0A0G4FEI5_VITBC|nr:unnamed protein product [Vitrella brassicaformis CCMP3155]|eukprot:CEM11619.1 unnamed protein product [Vitrella brassicaformis CCMP3155]
MESPRNMPPTYRAVDLPLFSRTKESGGHSVLNYEYTLEDCILPVTYKVSVHNVEGRLPPKEERNRGPYPITLELKTPKYYERTEAGNVEEEGGEETLPYKPPGGRALGRWDRSQCVVVTVVAAYCWAAV